MRQSLSTIRLLAFPFLLLLILPTSLLNSRTFANDSTATVTPAPTNTSPPAESPSAPATNDTNSTPLWISGQIITIPATAATPAPLAAGLPLDYSALREMENMAPPSFEILMRPSFKITSGDTARFTMTSRATREAGRITTTLLNMELTPVLQSDGRVTLSARIVAYGRRGRADSISGSRLLPPDSGHYEIFGPFRTNDRKLFVLLRVDRQPPSAPTR